MAKPKRTYTGKYKVKCDKCSAKLGDVSKTKKADGKFSRIPIFSFTLEEGGQMHGRCLKHLTTK